MPCFHQLRAEAQQLEQQAAARARPLPAPTAPPVASPVVGAHKQARREQHALHWVLSEHNRAVQAATYLPAFLRRALTLSPVNLSTAPPAGPDFFMPTSFWKSQNPTGSKKIGWTLCCATVYGMMESFYGKGTKPTHRYDLIVEHASTTLWKHGYKVHDDYIPAKDSIRAQQGLLKLDQYMAAHKPVMVGVSHTLGLLFTKKDKKGNTVYYPINDGTIDHFVAIVGMGVDKKGKYYRFFDVGITDRGKDRGTSPLNHLYYNAAKQRYQGTSQATGKEYVLTQLRF